MGSLALASGEIMPWIKNVPEDFVKTSFPEVNEVCISITQPERSEPKPALKGYVDTLRLEFSDTDPSIVYNTKDKRVMRPFTRWQADAIVKFVNRYRGLNIVVHCAAGISRSGAIVVALLEAMPEYEDKGWDRFPNKHVLSVMIDALGLPKRPIV